MYVAGCRGAVGVRYVLMENGEAKLGRDRSELRSAFAAIESPEEALSYAVAATGASAHFDFEPPRDVRYFVTEIEDTHVVPSESGFVVNLFDEESCGCGPKKTFELRIEVTRDGVIRETKRPVFERPSGVS